MSSVSVDLKYLFVCFSQFGWTPLHDCAQEGNVVAVGFLLDSGADANLCDMVRSGTLLSPH
jgi:ankyrin repeat protein